jgi:tetratricopeptide (TPR) repeat protein
MEAIHYYLVEAAEENREAASLLATGSVAQALEVLYDAINILDQLSKLPFIVKYDIPRPRYCTSIEAPFLDHERFFAYGRTVLFAPNICEICTMEELLFYRGVVCFNIAVATHMRGKVLREQKTLDRAIHYYDEYLNAVRGIPAGTGDVDLLRVAALNNKASIYNAMLNFDKAKEAVDEIRLNWRHALVLEAPSHAFDKHDIEGFILNTMEAIPPTAAACA